MKSLWWLFVCTAIVGLVWGSLSKPIVEKPSFEVGIYEKR